MSVRTHAVVGGVVLALAIVPSADAAKKRGKFTVTSLKLSKSSVTAGDSVRVSGKVANRKGRRTDTARVTYTLRKAKSSKKGARLGGDNIKRTRAGHSRKFSERVRIKKSTAARTYYVFACVRLGSGTRKASCKKRKLVVGAPAGQPGTGGPPPPVDTRNTSRKLRDAITAQGMLNHLKALQQIASEHGGSRASGFQGYGASVQYILTQLRGAGYNPTTQVFDFVTFEELSDPVLKETSPTAKDYTQDEFATMDYSASGDTGEQTITPVDIKLDGDRTPTGNGAGSGCDAADFSGFTAGDIALIQRGECDFAVKAVNAQNAGASGAIIFNQGNDPGRMEVVAGTLGETAQDGQPDPDDVTIPVVGISFDEGARLANETDPTKGQIVVDAQSDRRKSTNVIADTPTGNPDNVTIIGSHLDSVPEGPGINDNGSGSAFNLELALAFARENIKPANRVRFAFWGAEESGLVGSTRYVEAISNEAFAQIAANLNFDMLASPNHANLVYDGDFSDSPPPATAPDVNPGAAQIEEWFVDYFNANGVYTEPTAFDGRSDYKPFQDNGVAAGGLFSGAEVAKTADQAAKWGGTAGQPFDPCYHQACDDVDNLDMAGAETLADGGADVLAHLAEDPNVRATLNSGGGAAPRGFARSKRSGLGAYQGAHLIR
jgi:Zn-dependent M28 family amino/carboxypeptidase